VGFEDVAMSVSLFITTLVVDELKLRGLLSTKNRHSLLLEFSLSGSMFWGVRCLDL
jgi:hypothetical protein